MASETNGPLRVLGLDPGSRTTGWGCVAVEGSRSSLLACGCIEPPENAPLPQRLALLAAELAALLEQWRPAVAVLEEPFHGVNSRSLIVLAQARGALLATLATREVVIEEYSPAEVKSAVTGNGRAGKAQVTEMVTRILTLQQKPTPADAADALALAICHCWRAPLIARMAEAEAMAAEQRRKYQATLKAQAKATPGRMSRSAT